MLGASLSLLHLLKKTLLSVVSIEEPGQTHVRTLNSEALAAEADETAAEFFRELLRQYLSYPTRLRQPWIQETLLF